MKETTIYNKALFRPILGVFFLAFFLSAYWFWLDYKAFQKIELYFPEKEVNLEIKKGWGINHFAKYLTTEKIIASPFYMKLLAKQYPEFSQIKTGEYQIPIKIKPLDLLKILTKGNVVQYSFQIVEGQNKWEILNNLLSEKTQLKFELSKESKAQFETELIRKLALDKKQNKTEDFDIENLEGWLYPETYYYSKGDTVFSLLNRSIKEMKNILSEEWDNREQGLPLKSPYEALILASIIEKETGISSERERIAGVFIRRLQKKMRLQTDPTVIYGIGESFNGDITWKDLKTPTPYNTRIIKGLPPTPIASPSRASIYAALHPEKEEALYFVADGSGGHHFSKTLKEHNRAVKRWLKQNKN